MNLRVSVWQAAALLAGTTIGSGILGVPYAIARSGLLPGLLYLFGLGGAMLLLNMLFATVVEKTKDVKQLPGYVSYYLGSRLRWLMIVTLLVLGYGALTAYTAGSGAALADIFNVSPVFTRLTFLLAAGICVAIGVKTVSKLELFLVILITLLIGGVGILALSHTSFTFPDVSSDGNTAQALLAPYGVVLFAYLGFSSIPELRMTLRQTPEAIYRAVFTGTVLPIVLYTLFVLAVLGLTGSDTTRVATIGLGEALGPTVAIAGNLFAVVAMFTSFLALALVVKNMFELDLDLDSTRSVLLTFLPPILILSLGGDDFISILGVTGAISGGTMGILIVLMFIKIKNFEQKPWPLSTWLLSGGGLFLIGLLLLGMVVELFTTF